MAAVDVIYLLAAILWIGVVLAALAVGIRVAVKFRARRRRINRVLAAVRMPVRLVMWQDGLLANLIADTLDVPRKQVARGPSRHRRR
ncbi:MAG: hypothetical protein JWR11_1062 [Mycobacterium sp.]|jgi:hypothetical protein|nr:hypothetical protein [Mycobacterium sp.]MDT5179184.1 hypothetical protein [Mycobacterium sp.]